MTRLFIRLKSFYVIISFFLIVFLFYPLKTFGAANITQQLATQEDGNISTITVNTTTANTRTIQSWMTITGVTATTPINGVSIVPTGFYKENGEWYSKVFNGSSPAQITHTINWPNPTSASLNFKSSDNSLLRLKVISPEVKFCDNVFYNILKNDFFDNGNAFGYKVPNSNCNTGIISNSILFHKYPQYQVQAISVPAPSISTFIANSPASQVSSQSYKLISGNSFTLNWSVNNATATTTCTLTGGSTSKTFDNTDTDSTNDWSLSGTTGSFTHTISSLTADTTYTVSCTHNGVGTPDTKSVSIDVIPVPTVNFISVNGISGGTVITNNEPSNGDDFKTFLSCVLCWSSDQQSFSLAY